MFDFTEILRRAQGGDALGNLARQFGLPQEQARKAVEAMMPAFAVAMQRQMTDPQHLAALFALMTGRPQPAANPYLDAVAAFSPEAVQAGNAALAALFGSNEVTRAIADQIARSSGIGPAVLQPMMPVVAAMLMAGLRASMEQTPVGQMLASYFGKGSPGEPIGALGTMMNQMVAESSAKGPAAVADLMNQMLRAIPKATGETEPFDQFLARAPNPAGPSSLFDEAFGAFVRGFNRGRPEPKPEPADEFEQFVGQMFQAGKDVQASQMHVFEQILDSFWGAKP